MASPLLPAEVILATLNTVELLQSMFPLASELEVSGSSLPPLDLLRSSSSSLETSPPFSDTLRHLDISLPDDIRLLLRVLLDEDPTLPLLIDIVLPLRSAPSSSSPPSSSLVLRPPAWLSRSSFGALVDTLPSSEVGEEVLDEVLALVDRLREVGPSFVPPPLPEPVLGGGVFVEPDENGMDRVWFWFPSISTKRYRDDMIKMAPVWKLTGFLLAGKPGILCLEGNPKAVDEFMAWVKAVSWSDIPSFQKKVTERYRTPSITTRLFTGMVEITDLINHYGHRGNRGEMGEVRKWIEERGVGVDVLGKVLNLGPSA